MACIKHQHIESPQALRFPEIISSRARRPALIPPNCSLSLAEAEDLVQTRINQPLFPSPDPNLLQHVRAASPDLSKTSVANALSSCNRTRESRESPPKSNCSHSMDAPTMPKAFVRDPRRRAAWLKARAQYARDQRVRQSPSEGEMDVQPDQCVSHQPVAPADFGPKRKHSAFVKEQEVMCLIEDRVGTPHMSELQPGDEVTAQINVDELGIGGAISSFANAEQGVNNEGNAASM